MFLAEKLHKTLRKMKVKEIIEKSGIEVSGEKIGITRDKKDDVLRCSKTGIIYLDANVESKKLEKNYEEKKGLGNHPTLKSKEIRKIKSKTRKDDLRRVEAVKSVSAGKAVLDVGTGFGGFLDIIEEYADKTAGVELQAEARNHVARRHDSYRRVEDVVNNYDVITMFHVLEHMWEPIKELKKIRDKINQGGAFFVEVPHANDALIDFYEIEKFKKFTFWSEHLILHTRYSLHQFLRHAGFDNVEIRGVQRYGLANHMLWLKKGKPSGEKKWVFMDDEILDKEYERVLQSIGKTDTLMALCKT